MRRLAILAAAAAALLGTQMAPLATAAAEVPAGWSNEWPATNFTRHAVPLDEIASGGPPKDGIPAIDDPQFAPVAAAAETLVDWEPVLSLELDGDARAYPLSVLIWHEIVNDTVGGRPVAVTYCPLCNTGVAFDRTVAGEVTSFGTTGKLRHSDLVMYDRATESWWQQYEGRAIVGVRTGEVLTTLPTRLESFADFAERHPEGRVLTPADASRDYGRNPYVGYDSATIPFLYGGDYDGPGSPLMREVAVEGRAEAWSLDFLRTVGRVSAGDLEITWRPGQASALDAPRIADGRDVGTVLVERLLPGGARELAVYQVPFAFAFHAFHPDAPIRHVE